MQLWKIKKNSLTNMSSLQKQSKPLYNKLNNRELKSRKNYN
jgi:hypothetical protein